MYYIYIIIRRASGPIPEIKFSLSVKENFFFIILITSMSLSISLTLFLYSDTFRHRPKLLYAHTHTHKNAQPLSRYPPILFNSTCVAGVKRCKYTYLREVFESTVVIKHKCKRQRIIYKYSNI